MQDKEIFEALKVYLEEKTTDYAIMINGPWGCGKTFFVKNKLIKEIQKDDKKKCIYISLFGISSEEELINNIRIHMFNLFLDDRVKKRAHIYGNAINTSESESVSWLSKKLTENWKYIPHSKLLNEFLNGVSKKTIDFKNYIFIFDDFERCSMPIEALLGFLNGIADQNQLKAVVICNEDKIEKEKTYNKFKEKIIRLSLSYDNDLKNTFDKVQKDYINDGDVNNILCSVRENIISFYRLKKSKNIRTYIFICKRCEELYEKLLKLGLPDSVKEKLLQYVFMNVAGTSLLIKENKGSLKSKPNRNFEQTRELIPGAFKECHFELCYTAYLCVDKYITTYFFDETEFKKLIDLYIEREEYDFEKITREVFDVYEAVDDEEAVNKLESIINNIKNKEYNINVYPHIMGDLFNAIKVFHEDDYESKIEEIKKYIKKHIMDKVSTFKDEEWCLYNPKKNNEAKEFILEILEFLKDANKKDNKYYLKQILEETTDFIARLKDWTYSNISNIGFTNGFLSNMDLKILKTRLEGLSNKEILDFISILSSVYNMAISNFVEVYGVDKDALLEVIGVVEKIQANEKQLMKKNNYGFLLERLNDIREKLNI